MEAALIFRRFTAVKDFVGAGVGRFGAAARAAGIDTRIGCCGCCSSVLDSSDSSLTWADCWRENRFGAAAVARAGAAAETVCRAAAAATTTGATTWGGACGGGGELMVMI